MEITRENFNEYLPQILKGIESASFISFDEEMTGITLNDLRNKRNDDPESRYAKMQVIASRFSMIQFGMCLFHEEGEGNFVATPYCFYLFPDSGDDVILSASAIKFLRGNNMDFGKWISKGIPYVNEEGEKKLQEKYFPSAAVTSEIPTAIILTKEADKAYFDRNIQGFTAMLQSPDVTEYVFEKTNSFLRRAVYQHLESHFTGQVTASTNSEGRIITGKCNAEEYQAAQEKALLERNANLQASLGFRLVFNALVEHKKPLVGHNCTFDLLFLLSALHAPLPATFAECRDIIHAKFPVIFDTKYIFSCGLLGAAVDTALGDLYAAIADKHREIAPLSTPTTDLFEESAAKKMPTRLQVRFAEGFDAYNKSAQFHDAGYDAYCTGYLFADCLLHCQGLEAAISACSNKLFMMMSLYTVNLTPSLPLGHLKYPGLIYLLSNFPPTTSAEDILTVFTSAGFGLGALELMWIDGESTYVHVEVAGSKDAAIKTDSIAIPEGWLFKRIDIDELTCKRSLGCVAEDVREDSHGTSTKKAKIEGCMNECK